MPAATAAGFTAVGFYSIHARLVASSRPVWPSSPSCRPCSCSSCSSSYSRHLSSSYPCPCLRAHDAGRPTTADGGYAEVGVPLHPPPTRARELHTLPVRSCVAEAGGGGLGGGQAFIFEGTPQGLVVDRLPWWSCTFTITAALTAALVLALAVRLCFALASLGRAVAIPITFAVTVAQCERLLRLLAWRRGAAYR